MEQRRKIVTIGHVYGIVDCINPFNRKLKRLATTHSAHGGRCCVNLLRLNASIGKKAVIAVCAFKEVEIHAFTRLAW